MQGLIAIIILTMQLSGPTAEINNVESIGMMPEITVTAPRYENEDIAWSGLMPEITVTATRHENEDVAWTGVMPEVNVVAERYSSVKSAENQSAPTRLLLLGYETEPSISHIKSASNFSIVPCDLSVDFSIVPSALSVGGDYHLPKGDTIDEDVTVSGGNARIDGVIDGDLAVMGGNVDINGSIDGDVAVFGGNLDIYGIILGDAAIFGGNVKNKGSIDGDLYVVGGTVLLDSGAVVGGDISMVGGTVDRDEHAEVLGKVESVELDALQKVLPRISKVFRFPRIVPGAVRVFPGIFFISLFIVLYVLNLLIILIFPRAVERVSNKIQANVWASVGLGLALEILLVPLIVFLAVSIIGIPLIVVLPLAIFLALLFGLSALSFLIGERVVKGLNWKISSMAGLFSIGWLAIMIIPIVTFLIGPPIVALGIVIIYIVFTIGIGGVIYALIKRKNKEAKK